MNFEEFITDKKILEGGDITSYEALDLISKNEHEFDMIRFNHLKKLIFNIDIMQCDNEGKYYIDYEFQKDCDMVDNFNFITNDLDVTFIFICGGIEYKFNDVNEFILCAAKFNQFKLRIIFNKVPETDKEILLHYSKYFLKKELVILLVKSKIYTNSIIYNGDGTCTKKI